MSSNVIDLPVITRLNLDPDRVLNKAIGELKDVIIVGYDKDGNEYFASSIADGGYVNWLLDRMKLKLLRTVDAESSAE
jgi:hypothetical protein